MQLTRLFSPAEGNIALRLVPRSWGRALAAYLAAPRPTHRPELATPVLRLAECLMPGDVVLVEGHSRFSTAIKYLTQSTWSHAAVYLGQRVFGAEAAARHCFIEADVVDGVRLVGLESFEDYHARICRPVGLEDGALERLIDFLLGEVGHQYDLRNLADLARYLLPTPPVPVRFRRNMLALGSGDPTKAICSTLIARAFQSIHYPILPMMSQPMQDGEVVWTAREASLFVPRDFDVSPYFEVVKPTLMRGFDYRTINWA